VTDKAAALFKKAELLREFERKGVLSRDVVVKKQEVIADMLIRLKDEDVLQHGSTASVTSRFGLQNLRLTPYAKRVTVIASIIVGGLIIIVLIATPFDSGPTDPLQPSSSRYIRADKRQRVLVFVHGLYGDSTGTWTCARGVYWPALLLNDPVFQGFDIYVVGYETPYTGNRMSIDELVGNINQRLIHDRVFSDHKNVMFVSHSLGGLIVQRLLLTYRQYATQVPFIYFYSTPETGAQIVTFARLFSADPLLASLIPGDDILYLTNLENEWREARFGIKRYCAYERKSTNGVFVVERLSGTRGCDSAMAIPEDHAGIVKPCTQSADAYIALRNAIASQKTNAPEPDRLQ
jgi:pimeloyl-ACP methyl ester carboxylesterase